MRPRPSRRSLWFADGITEPAVSVQGRRLRRSTLTDCARRRADGRACPEAAHKPAAAWSPAGGSAAPFTGGSVVTTGGDVRHHRRPRSASLRQLHPSVFSRSLEAIGRDAAALASLTTRGDTEVSMEILEAIKEELDRQLAGRVRPEAYKAYLNDLFRCVRGSGQQAYLRRLADGSKGGEKE